MGVTVRQKTKGKGKPWWVFISHNGQRTSRRVGDKQAAETVATKIRAKLQLGDYSLQGPKKVPTFKEYAERFMQGYSKHNHKESTQEAYRIGLDRHLLPVFGNKPLDEIKKKNVKEFLYGKQGEGLSYSTVHSLKAYLSCILSQAEDDEIISKNPVAKTGKFIKKPEEIEDKIIPLTWDEKNMLEESVKGQFHRRYPLLLTALRTGVRIGELVALKPEDLDFERGFITVRRSCVRHRITSTKSKKIRKVDMSPQLAWVLKRYLTERKEEALKRGWGKPPEWLFYSEDGKIIDPKYLGCWYFQKWLRRAGVRRIRFHDLRHTYATLRLQKGDNILDVSKQLGHSDVKTTTETYYHWIPGANRNQVAELDLPQAPACTLSAPKIEKSGLTH